MSHFFEADRSTKKRSEKPDLLLHICCAPCATHTIEHLRENFTVTGFFFNPNIQPEAEFKRRLKAAKRLAALMDFTLICLAENQDTWSKSIKGYEDEPEGGRRCSICYTFRLDKAAQYAKKKGFGWFATTLTISPHKKASVINDIGSKLADSYGIKFYSADFKKENGFKKSCELSKKYELYRQSYCGCLFSLQNRGKGKFSRS
jgi:predicted adenine nucleotide alpha hydrolase (AANH) superfamily ATPase